MGISDMIAGFIMEAVDDANGMAELQRSSLAEQFSCVPSQINYVIATRFSPERGYIVESRRGGGGYIRITRVNPGPRKLIMHMINAVGNSLDERTAAAFISNAIEQKALDKKSGRLILAAVGNNALKPVDPKKRDMVRASIFKQILINTISE